MVFERLRPALEALRETERKGDKLMVTEVEETKRIREIAEDLEYLRCNPDDCRDSNELAVQIYAKATGSTFGKDEWSPAKHHMRNILGVKG